MNAFVVQSSVIMTAKFFEKINENTCFESTCSTSGAVRVQCPYGENRTARQPIRTRDSGENRTARQPIRTRDSVGNRTGKEIKEFYVRVSRRILFLSREHKIHIFELASNRLFITWRKTHYPLSFGSFGHK